MRITRLSCGLSSILVIKLLDVLPHLSSNPIPLYLCSSSRRYTESIKSSYHLCFLTTLVLLDKQTSSRK